MEGTNAGVSERYRLGFVDGLWLAANERDREFLVICPR